MAFVRVRNCGDFCQAQHQHLVIVDNIFLYCWTVQTLLEDCLLQLSVKMNRQAPVEFTYECIKCLITHNPTNSQLVKFIEAFGVQTLVRVCNAPYDKTPVEQEGITVVDWPFDDGSSPPEHVVDDWLNLLKCKFRDEPGCCIAVHCVAGLGRAPVLVALALIECGMEYEDAVHFIRQKRRGAFNSKQLMYFENYKPKMCLSFKDANSKTAAFSKKISVIVKVYSKETD